MLLRLAALSLLACLLAACAGDNFVAPSDPAFRADVTQGGLDPAAAARLVSAYRLANGRSLVQIDPRLNEVAREQARLMADAGTIGHDGFRERFDRSGYVARGAYENVGAGQRTLLGVFEGWRTSSGHKRAMLARDVRHIGIAAVPSAGRYDAYWALVLAEPYVTLQER